MRGRNLKTKGKAQPTWKWTEGIVDTDDDHIKITYGNKAILV